MLHSMSQLGCCWPSILSAFLPKHVVRLHAPLCSTCLPPNVTGTHAHFGRWLKGEFVRTLDRQYQSRKALQQPISRSPCRLEPASGGEAAHSRSPPGFGTPQGDDSVHSHSPSGFGRPQGERAVQSSRPLGFGRLHGEDANSSHSPSGSGRPQAAAGKPSPPAACTGLHPELQGARRPRSAELGHDEGNALPAAGQRLMKSMSSLTEVVEFPWALHQISRCPFFHKAPPKETCTGQASDDNSSCCTLSCPCNVRWHSQEECSLPAGGAGSERSPSRSLLGFASALNEARQLPGGSFGRGLEATPVRFALESAGLWQLFAAAPLLPEICKLSV